MNASPIGRAMPLACAILAGACTWAGGPVAQGPAAPVRAANVSTASAPPDAARPAQRVHSARSAGPAPSDAISLTAPRASAAPRATEPPRTTEPPRATEPPRTTERPRDALRCASAAAVLDGDSVVLRTQGGETLQVRIAAIDAPERGQPYADEARAHLAERVLRRALTLRAHERDRYGRTVADLWAGAPLAPAATPACAPTDLASDVGLAQLEAGYAWHFRRYASSQAPERRRAYAAAEQRARAARVGVWRDGDPTPPWQWRALARAARAAPPR